MRALLVALALMGVAACGTLTGGINGSFDVHDARDNKGTTDEG